MKKEAGVSDDPAPVQQARTRARRRLIGAVVLLAIGVVGFPLVFETRPRPVALDTPIEIAARPAPASAAPPGSAPAPAPEPAGPRADELPAPMREAAPRPPAPVETEPAETATPAPGAPAAVATPPRPPASASADDGARARALLEGASAPAMPRFIVQAGAYTDPAVLRDARARIEKLGLKTYTQVAEIDGAKRTRVRTGPYATREEADAAAAKLKAAGVASQVLTL